MASADRQPDDSGIWDEFQWESYLRNHDDRCEQYLSMLETFGDQPDGHNLIARWMGWPQMLTACRDEPEPGRCQLCPPPRQGQCRFHQSFLVDSPGATGSAGTDEIHRGEWDRRFADHAVIAYARILIELMDRLCGHLTPHRPCHDPLTRLARACHCCAAKTIGALSTYTPPAMRGLMIAQLKVAHQAALGGMHQCSGCVAAGRLTPTEAGDITAALLKLRTELDGLICQLRRDLDELAEVAG